MNNQNRCKGLLALLVVPTLLGGCAGVDRGQTMADIQAATREGVQEPEFATGDTQPDVSGALMPDVQVDIPGISAEALDQRFDVRVRRAPARDFFMSLVEETPYNMVVHPDVAGEIDLTLKNVTVPEVMAVVRDTYGYGFERSGPVFQVFPNTVQTRIFQVDYPDLRRSGYTGMESSTTSVSETPGAQEGAGGNNGGSAGSSVRSVSESDFWARIRSDVESIVGTEAGRRVSVNPLSGLILVRARPDELRDVARFLDASSTAVQRQVVLEARVLEVTLSEGYREGINWAELRNRAGEVGILNPTGTNSVTVDTAAVSARDASIPNELRQTASQLSSSVTSGLTFGLFARDFTAFFDLLKSQGDVQVLSSPRVSTVNNQKAVIKVGSDEFFVTDVESNTVAGTATTTNVSVELTPFFSGVSLDVTPQISAEGDVILHIHPAVSEVSEQTKNINTSAGSLTLPLAASTIRESDSVIRARNGQIVVIGGLMQNRLDKSESKVPLLGDLPLLGSLFHHKIETQNKTELVILLKPTLVEGPAQWSRQLRESVSSFERMEKARRKPGVVNDLAEFH